MLKFLKEGRKGLYI